MDIVKQIAAERGTGDHLCVLVHGLWGNPSHFAYLANALRAEYGKSQLQILITKRNTGRNTYDGIETCGERVAWEIESALDESAKRGVRIGKISIVGYSLGGLISRYAIGLLYSKSCFDKIKPVNFTTFATPHLGVRTPLRGLHNHIWNVLGARTLSVSGRQLFTIDNFRGTGRPLLSVLADRESVFYKGLKLFPNRILYANVANDRSTVFYTSAISRCNPFEDISSVDFKYLPGYAPNVINPEVAVVVSPKKQAECPPMMQRVGKLGKKVGMFPWVLIYSVIVCIGAMFYLVNAMLQNMLSMRRIRLHCSEEHCRGYQALPLAEELQQVTDLAIEGINQGIRPQHIRSGERARASDGDVKEEETLSPVFPTLALTQAQFKMIDDLDGLDFKKFSVWIHNAKHAHAAIIVRKPENEEGKTIVAHWIKGEFNI